MNKKLIALAVTAAMVLSIPVTGLSRGESEAVDYVVSKGLMEGDEKGDLKLQDTITRGELAKLIVKACGEDVRQGETAVFDDVPHSHWAAEYVSAAETMGIINGFGDGSFKPEDNVTKAQAIKIVLAACGAEFYDYPFGYIRRGVECGAIGDMELNIDEPITRQETAELIYNVVRAIALNMLDVSDRAQRNYTDENRYSCGYGMFKSTYEEYSPYSENVFSGVTGGGIASGSAVSGGGSGGGSLAAADSAISQESVVIGIRYPDKEEYAINEPNSFRKTTLSPLSTFSIDTDTAAYSNMRRFILNGNMPQKGSVRTEEIINYFTYDTPPVAEGEVFNVISEITDSPWSDNKLARITVAGGEPVNNKPQNLVFLVDVSGSMYSYNKLPMVKKALLLLLEQLNEEDRVSLITYASGTELVLESVSCSEKEKIKNAITGLRAGGGTNGADGLVMAYNEIEKSPVQGNNRIILCSDGDFNIGPSSVDELKALVEGKRKAGIYLTTAGFGMGNYKDNRMELLADSGNGSYYYIDTMSEAKRVFCDNITKTLYTVAEDVKIQVEFNPSAVKEYRLIGYENRLLNTEDFADDTIDAGELNAGSAVTAIYELVMNDGTVPDAAVADEYRYQKPQYIESNEAFNVKIRYKKPAEKESILREFPVDNKTKAPNNDTKLASAAAMLGLKLGNVIDISYDSIKELVRECILSAEGIYTAKSAERSEFAQLIDILKYIDYSL